MIGFTLYCITCLANDKMYIGFTERELRVRWREHLSLARRGGSFRLYRAMRKHGVENFVLQALHVYPTKDEVTAAEIELVAQLDLMRTGYNAAPGGYRAALSAESRRKISVAKRGARATPETRALMSAAHKGRKRPPRTPEHCAAIAAAKRGVKLSPEHRAKLSAAGRGRKYPPRTEEHRRNLSRSCRLKKLSADHKEKISDSLRHRVITPATRAKIAAHRKAYWAKWRIARGTTANVD